MSNIVLRYTGGGFIPGIPARDLTREDIKRLEKGYVAKGGDAITEQSLEQLLIDSGRYQRVRPSKMVARPYEDKSEKE